MGKQRIKPAEYDSNTNLRSPSSTSQLNTDNFISQSSLVSYEHNNIQTTTVPKVNIKSQLLQKKSNNKKTKSQLKVFLICLVSNFGIVFVFLGYSLLGAFIFQIMEQHQAVADCQRDQGDWLRTKEKYTILIYNYLKFNVTFNPALKIATYGISTPVLDGPTNYNYQIRSWLEEFRTKIANIGFSGPSDDAYCESTDKWQFWNSFLFAITVVSSIGYGHISPKSDAGQIVLCCYGLLGMPLFFMTISKISRLLADLYIFAYVNFVCFPCALYSSIQEFNEKKEENFKKNTEPGSYDKPELRAMEDYGEHGYGTSAAGQTANLVAEVEDGDVEDCTEIQSEIAVHVPLVFIVVTWMMFLFLSGLAFNHLENGQSSDLEPGTWNYVSSIYFMYISSTTIGFGDFSPAITHINNGDYVKAARNLLIGTTLIILGISVVGMVFSLGADGITENCRSILMKCGILKVDEESIDENCEIIEIDNFQNEAHESKSDNEKCEETKC